MKKLGAKSSTAVIYIGSERYQSLAKHAREISFIANTNITPSAFLHYLIEKYSADGYSSLLNHLSNDCAEEETSQT